MRVARIASMILIIIFLLSQIFVKFNLEFLVNQLIPDDVRVLIARITRATYLVVWVLVVVVHFSSYFPWILSHLCRSKLSWSYFGIETPCIKIGP